MKKTASKIQTFRRQGITILILLLALGAYFAVLVPSQRAFLTDRSFRVLAGMSERIKDTMANLGSSLTNAAGTTATIAASSPRRNIPVVTNSLFLTAISNAAPTNPSSATATNSQAQLDRIDSAMRLVPNLRLVEKEFVQKPGDAWSNRPPGLSYQVMPAGRESWLQLEYRGPAPSNLWLKARADLARLVKPIVNRREFDDMVIVSTNGEVLFQLADSSLRVTRLSVPFTQSSQTNLLNYAGREYKVFAQPLQFTPAAVGDGPSPMIHWVLCGLMTSERFQRQTLEVNYTLLLVCTFLGVLLVLSWPFLNVWSLGLKGGLRVAEAFLLVLSTVAMSAVLALLVLDLFAYEGMEEELDGQLGGFAARLEENFADELRQAMRQLDRLNERFPTNAASQTNLLANGTLLHLEGSDRDPYPFFQMATWSDLHGQQLVKWTVKDQNTPLINVRTRSYFRNLADGLAWTMQMDGATVRYSLEPIYSLNTGENLAVMGRMPAQDSNVVSCIDLRLLSLVDAAVPAGFGFCLIDGDGNVLFHSDERRNLRENFFEECNHHPRLLAAVKGRQEDRFDAKYAQSLHSLFVQPMRDFPWSLVTFREERGLATVQLEMASISVLLLLFYGALLAGAFGLGYALDDRRNQAWLWPSEKRSGTYALLTVLNLALAVGLGVTVFLVRSPGWKLILAFAGPAVAILLSYRGLSRGDRGSLWLRWASGANRFRISHRAGYVASMGSLLALLSLLPMLAFFKLAFDQESLLFVKHVQIQLARDLEARTERLWLEMKGVNSASMARQRPLVLPDLPAFFDRRWSNRWDIYDQFFFNTKIAWTQSAPEVSKPSHRNAPSFVDTWLPYLRPQYNQEDLLTRSVMADAADHAWWWTNNRPRLEFRMTGLLRPPDRPAQTVRVESDGPRWPEVSLLWALAFLALLALPFMIVRVIADKVLLLNLTLPVGNASSVLRAKENKPGVAFGAGRYLLLGPPHCGKSDLLTERYFDRLRPGAFRLLDLRRAEDRKWLEPDRQEELLCETGKALVIDHFDYNLDVAEFNHAKLRLLEHLAFDEARTVILVSNVHPLHFAMKGGGGGAEKPEAGQKVASVLPEAADWVQVLSAFRKLHCRSRATETFPAAPEGQTTQRARAFYRSLWHTCSPAEQEILYQVAQRRLISSYQPDLSSLIERGLLRRDPSLQLLDDAFQRFVLANYHVGTAVPDAAEEAPNLWHALRGPAVTVLIILAGFLFATQKDLWNNTVALATVFVTGIGAFAKVTEMFQKARQKKEN